MPDDIDCPGVQNFTESFGITQQADGPMAAFLKALIVLAQEVSRALPDCEDGCERTLGEPALSDPHFSLNQFDDGRWSCTLGATLEVEVACTKSQEANRTQQQRGA